MSAILKEVTEIKSKSVSEYSPFSPQVVKSLKSLGRRLKGKKISVIHINSAYKGGGVAELLASQVALERSLGINSRWFCIMAPRKFFEITKKIHNLLQGKPGFLSEAEKNYYLKVNSELGQSFKKLTSRIKKGLVVIHDPQPLFVVDSIDENFRALWRVHIDLSASNPGLLNFLQPAIEKFARVVVSNKDYLKSLPFVPLKNISLIYPAIDPLSEKNRGLDLAVARKVLEEFQINTAKPIMSQVSRFDPWKNPLGVIQSYYLAKNKIPELQLILTGFSFAQDDPEAAEVFKKTQKHAKGDPAIHFFWNPARDLKNVSNDMLINSIYTASSAVVQNSLKEGFGLTITEAMWKGRPVVANVSSGAVIQIKNGRNGFLTKSNQEMARRVVQLIRHPDVAKKLGRAARSSVRSKFLISKFLLDNMKVYLKLESPRFKKSRSSVLK